METFSALLCTCAGIGLVVLAVQRVVLAWAIRRPVARVAVLPPMSILKPLCGVDDGLEDNLRALAHIDAPHLEVLLGVRDVHDAAWPVALRMEDEFPHRFRVVLQRGAPGLNPKVNQLVTLEREAQHPLLVVSDSNARVAPGGLEELAALFEDPAVVCVSHPVSGAGHISFGALLDNLHLASSVGAGQVASKALANKDLVVGKSMALRRETLNQLGGFEAYANVLAEDYVIGTDVRRVGGRIAIARTPVFNVAVNRSVRSFFERYLRWSVIHRTAISFPTYLGQALLNPGPLAVLAVIVSPSPAAVLFAALVWLLKGAVDVSAARALRCDVGPSALGAVVVKDALLFIAWVNGLTSRTVWWRGNRLRVESGSRLVPSSTEALEPAVATR